MGSWVTSNTMSPAPRPTSLPSGILIIQPFGHNRHEKKIGALCPFGGGGAESPSNTMWPGPTSIPSLILIHPAVWSQETWAKNWGLLCPLFWGELAGFRSNTMWPGPKPTSVPNGILIHTAVWLQQTWAADYTDTGFSCDRKFRKWRATVPLSTGGAESPSNTKSPGPRPSSVPSGILIHPAVWPQYTNVTERQTD